MLTDLSLDSKVGSGARKLDTLGVKLRDIWMGRDWELGFGDWRSRRQCLTNGNSGGRVAVTGHHQVIRADGEVKELRTGKVAAEFGEGSKPLTQVPEPDWWKHQGLGEVG